MQVYFRDSIEGAKNCVVSFVIGLLLPHGHLLGLFQWGACRVSKLGAISNRLQNVSDCMGNAYFVEFCASLL